MVQVSIRVQGSGLTVLGSGLWVPGSEFLFATFSGVQVHRGRGTSLIKKRTLLGPYRRPVLRVLGGS